MHSKLIKYNTEGVVLGREAVKALPGQYFGEGADFLPNGNGFFVYQLTWQDRVV